MTHKALRIIPSVKSEDWKEILSDLLTDPEELLNILGLDISKKPPSLSALTQFPLKVPPKFLLWRLFKSIGSKFPSKMNPVYEKN